MTASEAAKRAADTTEVNPDTVRPYGQSEEGKARRTKDQMAIDKDIEEMAASHGVSEIPTDIPAIDLHAQLKAGTFAASEPEANISTGGERIDPTSEEDAAQDKADEAAEVEETRKGVTLDDLRQAIGAYQKKHGMAAAVEAIPALLGCAVADVKDEDLESAIAKVKAATEGAAPVEDKPAAPTATKQDVIDLMVAYAQKFDGTNNPGADSFTAADIPRILEPALGDGVTGLSKIPDDPEAYGAAVVAMKAAIEGNPFGRKAVA